MAWFVSGWYKSGWWEDDWWAGQAVPPVPPAPTVTTSNEVGLREGTGTVGGVLVPTEFMPFPFAGEHRWEPPTDWPVLKEDEEDEIMKVLALFLE